MAVETTTITGKVFMPNGAAAASGRVTLKLSQAGRAEDAGATQVVGGQYEARIASDGTIKAADLVTALTVVPNDAITPSGTYYRVDFSLANGIRWTEYWNVTTAPDPVEIGDIQRLNEGTVTTVAPTAYAVSGLPTASANYRGQIYLKQGGAGVRDQAFICLKGTDDLYDWIFIAEGE